MAGVNPEWNAEEVERAFHLLLAKTEVGTVEVLTKTFTLEQGLNLLLGAFARRDAVPEHELVEMLDWAAGVVIDHTMLSLVVDGDVGWRWDTALAAPAFQAMRKGKAGGDPLDAVAEALGG